MLFTRRKNTYYAYLYIDSSSFYSELPHKHSGVSKQAVIFLFLFYSFKFLINHFNYSTLPLLRVSAPNICLSSLYTYQRIKSINAVSFFLFETSLECSMEVEYRII